MPDLNRLVAAYKSRKDMVFLGLCLDDEDQLHGFLDEVAFTYQIIPDASAYIKEQLHVSVFPINIIVDKEGKVVKVMEGNAQALKSQLAKVAGND